MINTLYLDTTLDKNKFAMHLATAKRDLLKLRAEGVSFDAIAVSGNSGTLFGGALAQALDVDVILVRKNPNESIHSAQIVEGNDNVTRYIIVDDFISSGATVRYIAEKIHAMWPLMRPVGVYTYDGNVWRSINDSIIKTKLGKVYHALAQTT